MELILTVLRNRCDKINQIFSFCKKEMSFEAKRMLQESIYEGFCIVDYLKTISQIDEFVKTKIEVVLENHEIALRNIGMELPGEFCSIKDVSELFRDERLLLLIYLNSQF